MRCGGAYCGGGDGSIFNRGGYLTARADTGEAGDFSVTGDSGGYSYADNVLTIKSAGEYTITMASGVSSTSDDRIVVDADGAVELTISDISITSSADAPFSADGGDLTLILEGDNYLTASGSDYAALSKTSGDNKLTITSCDGDGAATGSLTATGSFWGAGIGGGFETSGNNIEIAGGTINAAGGGSGGAAGIGGGYWGRAYNILISGGVVNATGNGGAGIGSGFQAGYSSVTITGGYVNAVSGYGAAIGGGDRDYGTTAVSISGGYIKTTTGGGDSIGGGCINSTSTKQIAITGGCFAEGNISADTVYDTAVYTGYQVVSNTDSATSSDYPYMVETGNTDLSGCAFIITGSDITPTVDYSYKDNVLTIKKGGTYRISMNTAVGTSTTTDRIVVYADSAVELTICDIDITSSTVAAFRADAGDLTLVLEGDNYLTSGTLNWIGYAGLAKESSSNSLKITSCEGDGEITGRLTAIGGADAAGIGGGEKYSGSNIMITGGNVTATGGNNGAGIGGGYYGDGSDGSGGSGSNITISGGNVTATGGGSGAGIGGGGKGSGSDITISGGNVTATGGGSGAGIGGGSKGSGSDITISGGNVTATGGSDGTGIGGGSNGSGSDITISGGTVTAVGKNAGAGIGGGLYCSGSDITISGGTVTASSSGDGSGIGGGSKGSGSNITINSGIVTASSSNNGSGIGGGSNGSGSNITISSGTVTASSSGDGTGIGGGLYGNGSDITISSGTVTASGSSYGAGIGGGRFYAADDTGGSGSGNGSGITISGGTVTASSTYGAGIGGGGSSGDNNSKGSDITITGGYIKASSSYGDCIGSGGTRDNSNYSRTAAENISISGGYFAVGNISEGTVYGIAVKSTCCVASNIEPSTKADYPYVVTNSSVNAFVVSGSTGIVGEEGYTYENHVLTITKRGSWNIEMNTAEGITSTQTDRIVVDIENGNDVGVFLEDVSIISSYSPLSIENGEVYLLLKGDNYLTATGDSYSGLTKMADTPPLYIQSNNGIGGTDSLTAQGGDHAAGIGGYGAKSVSDINIISGVITATSGTYGAAIGAGGFGNASNITISGGTVTATAGKYGAAIGGGYNNSPYSTNYGKGSDITISGGYIKLSSENGDLIGNGYDYPGGDAENIVITGGYFGEGSVEDQTVYGLAVDDDCFVGLNTDSDTEEDYPYVVTEYTGDLVITGTDIAKGTDYTYTYDGVLTILKSGEYNISMASGVESTSDRIVVDADGDVELTITDINIINEDNSPFSANSGNLTLILDGDNYLTASSSIDFSSDCINYAALSKPGDTYSLTITSVDGDGSTNGSLTASGALQGAGIGGGNKTSSGNITIAGGTVTATGGMYGAGIGGGVSGDGTDITITGGNVTASSNTYGAGIGGGYSGEGSNIEITGGTVNATSDTAAGIGGGAKGTGSDITISGGTVTATSTLYGAGIGGGEEGAGTDITITGGTVNATSWTAAGIGGGYEADGSGITITGGTVNATATLSSGAAIGGGGEYSTGTDITISGGYITAKAGYIYIGGGYHGSSSNISITGGYFGKGDTEANTIYGITLSNGYTVVNNTDADTSGDYPYTIEKNNALVITGDGDIAEGTEYTYDNCVLTVLKSGAYTVTMASWAESTDTDRIVINADGDVELTISNINITSSSESPISADSGNLTLILDGDNYLTSTATNYAAISKAASNTLEITSADGDGSTNGSLTADGGKEAAAIGGDRTAAGNNITISGGTVNAVSDQYGAGIGGGRYAGGSNITITGGDVTASSTNMGAGIGGGQGSEGTSEGSNITISGGRVTASSSSGAGIGGGYSSTGASVASGITISGGFVTATSTRGAAIGSGTNNNSSTTASSSASGIKITGGTITANGYYGIGCGDSVNSTCEAAVIDGGSIKAANGFTTSPVNSAGSSVYLYELTDTREGEAIYIDGNVYIPDVVYHESEDTSQYLYLPETSETGLVYTSVDTAKYYDLSYENETSSAEYKGSVVLLTVDGETLMLDGTNNVDTSGITVAEENGVLSGIQVDTAVYGGENGTYLDIVGVSIDGVFYQLENYYYTDDSEQYAFFPVTRNSSESKESQRVRGAVGTKPNGADNSNIIYYITEGSDGLTIKEKE